MCGISAVILEKTVSNETEHFIGGKLRELILASEIRGGDGVGIAFLTKKNPKKEFDSSPHEFDSHLGTVINTPEFGLHKSPLKASEWMKWKNRDLEIDVSESEIVLAQNRLAIFGEDLVNQQPLVSDRYAITHNGNLFDFETVFQQEGLKRELQVDSELLLRLLDKYNDPNVIFDKVKGNFACLVIDRLEHKLYAFRRDKPLFMKGVPGSAMFFFSTERIGRKVFGNEAVIQELPEGRVFTYRST